MSSLISPHINSTDGPWAKVAGIYRRILLLRANGRGAEADRVYAVEFAAARAAAEHETGAMDSAESETLVRSLLDAEESRIAEALLFVEYLAPLVAERIRPALVMEAAASRAPFALDREVQSESSVPRPPAPRDANDPAPSIADLIDGMLVQERAPRRAT